MHILIHVSHDGKEFEGEAVLAEVGPQGRSTKEAAKASPRERANKPAGVVDSLYGTGYFATGRTLADVRGHMEQDGFNFGAPSILMALQAKDYLQRRGNKGSYHFVQKYPPVST